MSMRRYVFGSLAPVLMAAQPATDADLERAAAFEQEAAHLDAAAAEYRRRAKELRNRG